MGFTVVQECPQCGAAVELDEADHLLRCPYCEVNSFLFSDDCYRFVLPHKAGNRDLIFAPYLRFKGSVFSCDMEAVRYRIVDITQLGVPFKGFPISLGLRPQAMKMRFAQMDGPGSFIKCLLKTQDLLARAERHSAVSDTGEVFHRVSIGEAMSLIYLPLYVENRALFDGITNRPIAGLAREGDIFASITDYHPRWSLTFMATLCPQCGWNLTGERDSVVLTCSNCETAWEAEKGKFIQIDLAVAPGDGPETFYLPFWKMSVQATGIPIASYADFIRATNQPRVIQKAWEDQEMTFWSPAFKLQPNRFLYLSRQLTLVQPALNIDGRLPEKHLYPVTLPLTDALQGITITLAGSAVNKKKLMPRLPDLRLSLKGASLVYLPFHETAHEMVQKDTHVSINKKSLEFGRFL
ncbi:MAG: hypothetical protein QG552_568 [Thermodesulfobacteriota bacterium]|nr:hypothetical protein [Thermodesulfobacteriota bacterium]